MNMNPMEGYAEVQPIEKILSPDEKVFTEMQIQHDVAEVLHLKNKGTFEDEDFIDFIATYGQSFRAIFNAHPEYCKNYQADKENIIKEINAQLYH